MDPYFRNAIVSKSEKSKQASSQAAELRRSRSQYMARLNRKSEAVAALDVMTKIVVVLICNAVL